MLHYVRGDGGMVVVPKEELVRWLKGKRLAASQTATAQQWIEHNDFVSELLAELEAMGK